MSRIVIARCLSWILTGLCVVVLAALGWMAVQRQAPATWLETSGPQSVRRGTSLPFQLRLPASFNHGFLSVNLHWATKSHSSRGVLSVAESQAIRGADGLYSFQLPVPPNDEVAFVYGVFWVGPSPRWEDRTLTATTEPIPVRPAGAAPEADGWRTLRAFEPEIWRRAPQFSQTVRIITAFAWLSVGLILYLNARKRRVRGSSGAPTGSTTWALPIACLAAAVWELGTLDMKLAGMARSLARSHQSYDDRGGMQIAASLALVLGVGAIVFLIMRKSFQGMEGPILLGLSLFAVLAGAAMISLHRVDQLAYVTVGAVPLIQWFKLASAGITLAASAAREVGP